MVVYAYMQYTDSRYYDCGRTVDVDKMPQGNKLLFWIQDNSLDEKLRNLAVCAQALRKTVVHTWADNSNPLGRAQFPFYYGTEKAVGTVSIIFMTVQCIILIISVFPTEIALKKKFNDDGTRKY